MELWVAGPGALLVAKVHKITDRADVPDRLSDKEALDVLRILRAVETDDLAMRINALARSRAAGVVTREAVARLRTLFAVSDAAGVAMAVRASGAAEDAATVGASFAALIDDLLAALEQP